MSLVTRAAPRIATPEPHERIRYYWYISLCDLGSTSYYYSCQCLQTIPIVGDVKPHFLPFRTIRRDHCLSANLVQHKSAQTEIKMANLFCFLSDRLMFSNRIEKTDFCVGVLEIQKYKLHLTFTRIKRRVCLCLCDIPCVFLHNKHSHVSACFVWNLAWKT